MRIHQRDPSRGDSGAGKWFNSKVTVRRGTLSAVRAFIPEFDRRPFRTVEIGEPWHENERLDMIVRRPFRESPGFIPVGVVSKEYFLVPHSTVLELVSKALQSEGVEADEVEAELRISEYGERMGLSVHLPKRFIFDPRDGHEMGLRLECINSVDGTTRFRALMGWFRFICGNGLVIGVTRSDIYRRHVGGLQVDEVAEVLRDGLKESKSDVENFRRWERSAIKWDLLSSWVDGALRQAWGFKAATRAYHIVGSGHDVELAGQYKGNAPTTVDVRETGPVPGAAVPSESLFDVIQALAWLAKERRDVQEQLEWREQIPELMEVLIQ